MNMLESHRSFLVQGEQAGARYTLAPPLRLPMGMMGAQLGQRAGSSLEFKEHREYQIGDDLRRIDWNAYARSDRLTVKLYREEVSPHVDILLDGSASMDLPDSGKAGAALAIAAAVASAADNSGYSRAAWLARSRCEPVAQGSDSPRVWEGIEFNGRVMLPEALQAAPPRWRSQSIRVVVSDLLWMADPLAVLQQLGQRASAVFIVQVLAQSDVDPPDRGSVRLEDSETGELREVFLDASAQRRYRDGLARHQDGWQRACTQAGAAMTTLVAEDLLKTWDLSGLVQSGVLRIA